MSHRRRFIERHLPPLIDVSELSDEQVDIAFNQIVGCELSAETAPSQEEGCDRGGRSDAASMVCRQ